MRKKAVSKLKIIEALPIGERVTARQAMKLILSDGFDVSIEAVRQALHVISKTGAMEFTKINNTLRFVRTEESKEIFISSTIAAASLAQSDHIKETNEKAIGNIAPRQRSKKNPSDIFWGEKVDGIRVPMSGVGTVMMIGI